MRRFIQNSIKPALMIFGILTTSTAIISIFPEYGTENLLKLEFSESYKILIQHWSFLIFLVGIFLIISVYKTDWRFPIVIFAAAEKSFIIYLYIRNIKFDYSDGFLLSVIVDSLMVIYFLLYIFTTYNEQH